MSWSFYNTAGFLKVNTGRELVSTLPSSPVNGQEVFYQSSTAGTGGGATNSMADVGAVWHLRYRAASASAYKWEFVGGAKIPAQLLGEVNGGSLSANTWADISTAITATVPTAGDYFVQAQSSIYYNTATSAALGIKVGATEPTLATDSTSVTAPAAGYATLSLGRYITSVAASTVLTLRFRSAVSQSAAYRDGAGFTITPIRVG